MTPDFFDTLARAALSRAGHVPRDRLAGLPDAAPAARAVPSRPTHARSLERTVSREAQAPALSRTDAPPANRTPSRAPIQKRSPSARTPPRMNLGSYLERRRGRP